MVSTTVSTTVSATGSATVSATPTQQQLTDVQTGLPVSTIIILSTVIPSTLVLLMLVCTVVVIILIVRWRISARKQVDTAHEHKGKHTNCMCSEVVYYVIKCTIGSQEEGMYITTFKKSTTL